jgi:hypothetical protein
MLCNPEFQMSNFGVPIPETTSAEAFERYVGGKCLVACRGKAWRDIKAWVIAPLREVEVVHLPSVSEPFLAWGVSGEADFEEREGKGPWIKHRIKRGSFFLTSGRALRLPLESNRSRTVPVHGGVYRPAATATRAGRSVW